MPGRLNNLHPALQDKKVKGKIDARNKLETYVYNIKSSVEDKLKDKISEEEADTVKKAVADALEWCATALVSCVADRLCCSTEDDLPACCSVISADIAQRLAGRSRPAVHLHF